MTKPKFESLEQFQRLCESGPLGSVDFKLVHDAQREIDRLFDLYRARLQDELESVTFRTGGRRHVLPVQAGRMFRTFVEESQPGAGL